MKKMFGYYFSNTIDAFIPELWAREGLAILEENMVMANLVHRDFENEIASFGDVVHTRRPGEFAAKRKIAGDDVTIQNASATDVQVPLNQHVHTSFMIRDEEQSKSFQDLISIYLRPAMLAQARFVDQLLCGQVYQFLANVAGGLGAMTSSNSKDYLLDVREKMNINKAYMAGRNLIIPPNMETELLRTDLFVSAERVGDAGTALREASLGRKFGFDIFMDQNQPSIDYRDSASIVLNDAATAIGDTVITMGTSPAHGITTGGFWLKIAGDLVPQLVLSVSTNDVTIYPGLTAGGLATAAVVTRYDPGLVDQSSNAVADGGDGVSTPGYYAGWAKAIHVDNIDSTKPPKVGQMVQFGAATTMTAGDPRYCILQVLNNTGGACDLILDRPLDAAIVNNGLVALGPSGDYGLAFHRNAIALVNRPLALPRQGVGAIAGQAVGRGLSMRACITYDGKGQGHLVTLDMLLGVKVLDTNLAAVLLG